MKARSEILKADSGNAMRRIDRLPKLIVILSLATVTAVRGAQRLRDGHSRRLPTDAVTCDQVA